MCVPGGGGGGGFRGGACWVGVGVVLVWFLFLGRTKSYKCIISYKICNILE